MDCYTKEGLRELISNLYEATDDFKYLVSAATFDEPNDDKLLLPNLLEHFDDLKTCCGEYISAYNFYVKKYEEHVAKEKK